MDAGREPGDQGEETHMEIVIAAVVVALGLAAGVSFGEQVGWPVAKAQRRGLPPASRARRPRIF